LTAQSTADSELAHKISVGKCWTVPHVVWNWHPAVFNCFSLWKSTYFTCNELLNVLSSYVWHNFLCI